MSATSDKFEPLVVAAMNDKSDYDSIMFAVKHLRSTMDRVAKKVAKANAEWMDDPEAEDYADYHAPADVQFPKEARDEAICELVRHYLSETK